MNTQSFLDKILIPGLEHAKTWAAIPYDDRSKVGLMAIAGQESGWAARRQTGCYTSGLYQTVGARGFWQFERYGAVGELMSVTSKALAAICQGLGIPMVQSDLYEAIAWNDTLACAMGRLLLWQDPQPLPGIDQQDQWWEYYVRNWRPGAPRPADWEGNFQTSLALVKASVLAAR
jgi:hypothetical protein